ncbi:uncharacterized protein BDV14DRAFT_167550 [Aspergillus stella-maris]|uniref:uncharacterized protein n=1 Tax=Aspergillus stella-maris TaxID=1810926 RepID=UPI003CCCF9B2
MYPRKIPFSDKWKHVTIEGQGLFFSNRRYISTSVLNCSLSNSFAFGTLTTMRGANS